MDFLLQVCVAALVVGTAAWGVLAATTRLGLAQKLPKPARALVISAAIFVLGLSGVALLFAILQQPLTDSIIGGLVCGSLVASLGSVYGFFNSRRSP